MQHTDSSSIARILASAWQQQRNGRTPRLFWGWVAFWVLAPLGLFAWLLRPVDVPPAVAAYPQAVQRLLDAHHHTALVGGTTMISFVFVIAWFGLVTNLRAQNNVQLARLVPGHVARLRTALLVAWALAILAAAAVPGMLLDAPLPWAFGAATVLALVALAQRWRSAWLAVVAAPMWLNRLFGEDAHPGSLGVLSDVWPHSDWLVMAIVLTAGALGLVAVLREQGHRPRSLYEAGRAWGRRLATPSRAGCASSQSSRMSGAYAWWLARVLARRDGTVGSRLLLGLGPASHWTTRMREAGWFVVVGGGICVVVVGLAALLGRDLRGVLPWLSFSLLTGVCTPALLAAAHLHRTQREQALLALLPGVPRGPVLNRWLGWQMTLLFVGSALFAFVLAGALDGLAELLSPGLVRRSGGGDMTAAIAVAVLPQVALQWRGWARQRAGSGADFVPSLAPFALGGLAWALHELAGCDYLAMGIALAAAAAAWCTWRWWRMAGEPTALPVGRLAR